MSQFDSPLPPSITGPQGPRYAGKLTNELIYDQLPPGVRQELERLNPRADRGRRKFHHHRFLTGDIGNPHLEKVVAVVTALMRISPDWGTFMRNFNRNFRHHLPEQRDLSKALGVQLPWRFSGKFSEETVTPVSDNSGQDDQGGANNPD